jgi:hypothetical protein
MTYIAFHHDKETPLFTPSSTPAIAPHLTPATQYLDQEFASAKAEFAALAKPIFGTAYRYYQRYMLASGICSRIGLDLHKPSLTKHTLHTLPDPSLVAILLTRNDILKWADISPGSFDNYKTTVSTAEGLRARLANRQDPLTPVQLGLVRHLELLAGVVTDSSTRLEMAQNGNVVLGQWNLKKLRAEIGLE